MNTIARYLSVSIAAYVIKRDKNISLVRICFSSTSFFFHRVRIVVSPRYTDFYRHQRITGLTIRSAPRQLKPMATRCIVRIRAYG